MTKIQGVMFEGSKRRSAPVDMHFVGVERHAQNMKTERF